MFLRWYVCTYVLAQVNGREFQVRVTGKQTFELVGVDTSHYGDYIRGGYITQVKQPVTLSFKPLSQALGHPGDFLLADWAKMDRAAVLHVAFQALHEFANRKVRTPVLLMPLVKEELLTLCLSGMA